MAENYYIKLEREAGEKLEKLLDKPIQLDDNGKSIEEFDPWEIFPFYGNYSSEFDDMALTVLNNLLSHTSKGEELAHEMFREVLCKLGYCDYGTSPRVCFPSQVFKELLPKYIAKWELYYKKNWDEDYEFNPNHKEPKES